MLGNGGLTLAPNVNLIGNMGFSDCATHTTVKNDKLSNMSVQILVI